MRVLPAEQPEDPAVSFPDSFRHVHFRNTFLRHNKRTAESINMNSAVLSLKDSRNFSGSDDLLPAEPHFLRAGLLRITGSFYI